MRSILYEYPETISNTCVKQNKRIRHFKAHIYQHHSTYNGQFISIIGQEAGSRERFYVQSATDGISPDFLLQTILLICHINGQLGWDKCLIQALKLDVVSWWRHPMEIFSALLAICEGNSPVTGEFPAQRPVTRSLDVFLICAWINGWVNNREAGDLRHYRTHYDVTVMFMAAHR